MLDEDFLPVFSSNEKLIGWKSIDRGIVYAVEDSSGRIAAKIESGNNLQPLMNPQHFQVGWVISSRTIDPSFDAYGNLISLFTGPDINEGHIA